MPKTLGATLAVKTTKP